MSFSRPFVSHYNLGALYFKKEDYPQAIQHIRDALQTDFVKNISYVSSSRIYFPLIKNPKKIDEELNEPIIAKIIKVKKSNKVNM